jgi:hypothetical protein
MNAHSLQFDGDIAAGALAVVGKKQKRNIASDELINEMIGAANQFATFVNNTIHVDQITLRHSTLQKSKPSRLPYLAAANAEHEETLMGKANAGPQQVRGVLDAVSPINARYLCE